MAGGPDKLEAIWDRGRSQGGFDFRRSKRGSYGRGSYFAHHAVYSAYLYPAPDPESDGSVTMLVAEVALGSCKDFQKQCKPDLFQPPPLEPSRPDGELYDSIEGTEDGYGIDRFRRGDVRAKDARRYAAVERGSEQYGRQYVVFHQQAAYPKYLVTMRADHPVR